MIEAALSRAGAEALLCGEAANVRWLGGPPSPADAVVAPWAAVPAALVVGAQAPRILVAEVDTGGPAPPDAEAAVAASVIEALAGCERIGVDGARARGLAALAGIPAVEFTDELLRLRAIKSEADLAAVAVACAAASAGQRAVRAAAIPETLEMDLLGVAESAIRAAAGSVEPLVCDMMAGARTSLIGVPATLSPLPPGEPLLCDLAPRVDGWWGDSCSTLVPPGTPRSLVRDFDRARHALEVGAAALRPGVTAGSVHAVVLGALGRDLPHHLGHGVGTSPHELPRIVHGSEEVLAAGMVVALEPGLYDDRGVRVEHVYAIGEDGAAPLTDHDL